MLDLLVKGFQLWELVKSENIWIRKKWKTPLRMVYVQVRTKRMRGRRNPKKRLQRFRNQLLGGLYKSLDTRV